MYIKNSRNYHFNYSISKSLKIKHGVVLNLSLFLSLRNTLIKMIKIVCITLVIVSNMVDQGRIILQNFGLCNLSIALFLLNLFYLSKPRLDCFRN